MLLMLAAIDQGLETAIFGATEPEGLRTVLGLPDDFRFVAVVTMGYPADGTKDAPSRGASVFMQRRKPRDQVVRWERWS
jgi:nitroreductase